MQVAQIIKRIDRNQPPISFAFTALVVLVALGSALSVPWRTAELRWGTTLFFLVLAVFAELFYVELPQGKGRVSVGFGVILGGILILSPQEAALVAAGGVFFANLFQGVALDVILFNTGQLWIVAGSAASFWRWVWGMESLLPISSETVAILVIGVLGAALIYYFLNITIVSVGIALAHRTPIKEVITRNVFWGIPNYLSLGSIGFLIAVLHENLGMYGVLLVWVPLLLARYSFQQYMDMRAAHLETIQALATALDARDPYTRGHSERVSQYAEEIARSMKLSVNDIETIRVAGVLHDIGKIGISDSVLNKVGRLTEEEFQIIRAHTTIGAQMVRPIGFLQGISLIIRHHHERFDGRGYPEGLAGEDIPLGARIMGVADAFDAMTYDRIYRRGMDVQAAVEQLIEGRGTQFDPQVVDVFVHEVLPAKIDLTQDATPMRLGASIASESDQLWQRTAPNKKGG